MCWQSSDCSNLLLLNMGHEDINHLKKQKIKIARVMVTSHVSVCQQGSFCIELTDRRFHCGPLAELCDSLWLD